MEHTYNHPKTEKQQIKFHNHNANIEDIKKLKDALDALDKRSELSDLQRDFSITEEFPDVEREFEIQYEQFMTNISDKRLKATRY